MLNPIKIRGKKNTTKNDTIKNYNGIKKFIVTSHFSLGYFIRTKGESDISTQSSRSKFVDEQRWMTFCISICLI